MQNNITYRYEYDSTPSPQTNDTRSFSIDRIDMTFSVADVREPLTVDPQRCDYRDGDSVQWMERSAKDLVIQELQHIASLLEKSPDPVIEIGRDGRILFCNAAARRLFPGILSNPSAHDVLHGITDAVDALARSASREIRRDVLVDDTLYEQRMVLDDNARTIRLYLRDITHERRLEEELAALRDRITGHVATDARILEKLQYDMRTEMNIILGYADLLNDSLTFADAPTKDILSVVIDAGQRVNELLGALAAPDSPLNAPALPPKHTDEVVHLATTVHDCIDSLRLLADIRNISIELDVQDFSSEVRCDPEELQEAIASVLEEVMHETVNGSIRVTVQQLSDDASRVCCTAHSTAVPGEYRIAGRDAYIPDPASLSLSVIRSLMRSIGGSVTAGSTADNGLSVELVFPLGRTALQRCLFTPDERDMHRWTARNNDGSGEHLS